MIGHYNFYDVMWCDVMWCDVLAVERWINWNCDCADELLSSCVDNERLDVVRAFAIRESDVDNWRNERRWSSHWTWRKPCSGRSLTTAVKLMIGLEKKFPDYSTQTKLNRCRNLSTQILILYIFSSTRQWNCLGRGVRKQYDHHQICSKRSARR